MARIICDEDYGNAPKKAQLRDFNVAFAENDVEAVLTQLADKIEWQIVGERIIHGIDEVRTAVKEMRAQPVEELRIDHILTHGAEGTVDGLLTMSSGEQFAFCDVYTFSSAGKNAKIKKMRSYLVAVVGESGSSGNA